MLAQSEWANSALLGLKKSVFLAMARATAAETSDRIDALQGMILEGESNTACLTFARQQWGISRAQGYKLLKRAWTQFKDDVDETGIDRLECWHGQCRP